MANTLPPLVAPIIFDPSGARKGRRDAERELDRLNAAGKRAMGGMKVAAAGAAAGFVAVAYGAVKLGQSSVKAAIESEKAMAKVKAMVEAAGVSWKTHGDEIQRVIDIQSRKSGYDDEELAQSFANLTRVTKDHNQALKLNALAMDLARGRGMSLAQASTLIGRVASGANVSLARYGIVLGKNATVTEKLAAIQKQFAGQTEAYGRTTQGSIDKASVAWENLRETIGSKLAPIVARFFGWVSSTAIPTLERWWPTIERVAKTVGDALSRAFAAVRDAAVRAWPVVRRAVEQAVTWIDENVVPIIRGVVRIASGLWDTFGDTIERVVSFIGRTVKRIGNFLDGVIKVIRGILNGDWSTVWAGLKQAASAAVGQLVDLLKTIPRALLDAALNIGKRLAGAIKDGFRSVIGSIWDLLRSEGDPSFFLERTGTAGGRAGFRIVGRAMGGYVPGPRGAGDVVPAMLTPGEVVLNQRQQSMLGRGRIASVLSATGGVLGGRRFAQGGWVTGDGRRVPLGDALQFAREQVGEPYGKPSRGESRTGPDSWDCSGYATTVAAKAGANITVGGTTVTAWGESTPARGNEPVVFGFRSNNGRIDGGYDEHMGIRINGNWFDAGGRHGGVGTGDSNWTWYRVPNGLQGLRAVTGDFNPQPDQNPPARTRPPRPARFRPLSTAVMNALRGGGGPETPSLSDSVSSTIGSIGRDDSLQDKRNRRRGEGAATRSITGAMPQGAKVNEDEVRLRGDLAVLAGRRKDVLAKKGVVTKALKRVRTAIRNLKKRKTNLFKRLRTINAKTRGWQKKRQAIIDDIKAINERLTERWGEERGFRDQLADIAVELAELNEDIGDVTSEIAATPDWIVEEGDVAGPDEGADAGGSGGGDGGTGGSAPEPEAPAPAPEPAPADPPAPPDTEQEWRAALLGPEGDLARAGMTPGDYTDDLRALGAIQDVDRTFLGIATQRGDAGAIAAIISHLSGIRNAMTLLNRGPGGVTLNVYPSGAAGSDPRALASALSFSLRTAT